jgi:hypothetical protein
MITKYMCVYVFIFVYMSMCIVYILPNTVESEIKVESILLWRMYWTVYVTLYTGGKIYSTCMYTVENKAHCSTWSVVYNTCTSMLNVHPWLKSVIPWIWKGEKSTISWLFEHRVTWINTLMYTIHTLHAIGCTLYTVQVWAICTA